MPRPIAGVTRAMLGLGLDPDAPKRDRALRAVRARAERLQALGRSQWLTPGQIRTAQSDALRSLHEAAYRARRMGAGHEAIAKAAGLDVRALPLAGWRPKEP